MRHVLALHTWSLDTTPLADVLRIIRDTGWDAVELRRLDFDRAAASGQTEQDVLALVRDSGVAVAAVGVGAGWMYADRAERERLLDVFTRSCVAAAALGCPIVMSPVDRDRGDMARAAASVRQVGDIAARHGVRLALEFNSQVAQFNSLESVREVLALAAHPACGLLLDTYHLERSGRSGRGFAEVAPDEIAYVQYSDVPRQKFGRHAGVSPQTQSAELGATVCPGRAATETLGHSTTFRPPSLGVQPGSTIDRLPPGQGSVAFDQVFGLLAEKGYAGPLSYEAPNPAAWERDPRQVAAEALSAIRSVLSTAYG
jgi:2-keto-myo-inositol isomerase